MDAKASTWNGGRFTKRHQWKWALLVVVVVIGGAVGTGLALSHRSSTTTSGAGSRSSATGLCTDKLTQMEQNGTLATMLQEHQNMMEQMRVSLSPQMQQDMDADPMWKSMRSGDFTQMMQGQQQQIDQMLGTKPTCGAP